MKALKQSIPLPVEDKAVIAKKTKRATRERKRYADKKAVQATITPPKVVVPPSGVPLESLPFGTKFTYQGHIYQLLNRLGVDAIVVDLASGSDEAINLPRTINVEIPQKVVPQEE